MYDVDPLRFDDLGHLPTNEVKRLNERRKINRVGGRPNHAIAVTDRRGVRHASIAKGVEQPMIAVAHKSVAGMPAGPQAIRAAQQDDFSPAHGRRVANE
jgi:hypothetical protein